MSKSKKQQEDENHALADAIAAEAAGTMDFIEVQWQNTVRKAEAGDTRAARQILKEFSLMVAERSARTWNGPIPFEYASFLAEAFKRITMNGFGADYALGLRQGVEGRPSHSGSEIELKRLKYFRYCLRVLKLKATGSYETLEEAKKVAARKLRVPKSRIDLAWKSSQRLIAEYEFKRKRGK